MQNKTRKIDTPKIRKVVTVWAGQNYQKAEPRAKVIASMMLVVKDIKSQLGEDISRLDLSNAHLADVIGSTERYAKTVRLAMLSAGVIYFPKWSAPKKPGDYPLYLVANKFIKWEKVESKRVSGSVPKSSKYLGIYQNFKGMAKAEIVKAIASGELVAFSARSFSIEVSQCARSHVEAYGLNLTDLETVAATKKRLALTGEVATGWDAIESDSEKTAELLAWVNGYTV